MLLGSTLVMALLPLGILSMVQTWVSLGQVDQAILHGIDGASQAGVSKQIELIQDAQSAARTISYIFSVGMPLDIQSCNSRMKAVVDEMPQATLVTMITTEGEIECASSDEFDKIAAEPALLDLPQKPDLSLTYIPQGPISGKPVIMVGVPVIDAQGRQMGAVALMLIQQAITPAAYQSDYGLWQAVLTATYTSEGVLLAADRPVEEIPALLPANLQLNALGGSVGEPYYSYGTDGQRRIVSITRVADDVNLLAIWEQEHGASAWASRVIPYLLPALTWAAALIAAYIASQRLVVRHVRALARAMTAYMSHRKRETVPGIADSPAEIQRLHGVYAELIAAIEQDEAELENLLVDKDRLLREVHHRSGNSLQIIASVLRMYRRESGDPALRGVLDGLINRVIALSSTHTSLYGLEGRQDVPMDAVLNAVIHRLKEIHGIPIGSARKQFQPITLPAQAAIPLALALAETVSCFFGAKDQMKGGVDVALDVQGQDIRLYVEGPNVPEFQPETTHGLASLPRRMLTQFAGQLRGRVVTRIADNRSMVELTFPRNLH
ncbi:histidine kinase dimerization/phosphoacceptor domain -containing protein [Xinfangfangia sp. CPCC 101601]|uniref:histidine kinase n=1 Tax=Pseudogemmobacter lacusdianii TaxID=3069608 RepID=A0ABU0W1E1_9RHOB|nr:histidine kinase dimerization/phosphoacceptor domain -containing protein [Xinfangfangia sp. CPCC 101601]MDQ2067818.1 histidine kinase dimerization/phosphoacceptor domain -containing protein [Xinfangfangia sp. CPCC 101601]